MPGSKKKRGIVSKAQQGFLFAKKPSVAKKLANETPKSRWKRLPKHK